MFKNSHNLKKTKDGFAILAALIIVVIFSIAISQWLATDLASSKFKITPIIYAKNLAQAQQINGFIGSSIGAYKIFYSQASLQKCLSENSACSRYINATQNAVCNPPEPYQEAVASQGYSIKGKKVFILAWHSSTKSQITTCVSDENGENLALSIWHLNQTNNDLSLLQEDEF
jgi:hypothetical protein